jgi:hypothetical protein
MVATVFQNGYKSAKAALPHQQTAQTHRQKVKDMLPNRVVGYSPDLTRIVGGATIGLFLNQLLFLSDKGANPEGWVYKSEAEMGKETGLTKREQQTARRKLLALGVIAIMRGGWKNTYHFKVIWEKLYQVIAGFQREQTVPTEQEQNVSTRWKQNAAALYRDNREKKRNRENRQRESRDLEQSFRTSEKRPAAWRNRRSAYWDSPYRNNRDSSTDWCSKLLCHTVA